MRLAAIGVLAVLLLSGRQLSAVEEGVIDQLQARTAVPTGILGPLVKALVKRDDGAAVAVGTTGGVAAALAVVPVIDRPDPTVSATLREQAVRRAEALAVRTLLIDRLRQRAADERLTAPYDFDEALLTVLGASGKVAWLAQGTLGPGMNRESAVSADRAAVVIWLDAAGVELLRGVLPTAADLTTAYADEVLRLARAAMANQDHATAIRQLGSAIRHGRTEPPVRLDAVSCCLALGQRPAAEQVAVNIWEAQREALDTATAERVGDVLLELGRRDLAAQAFERALTLDLATP
jgi:tetratricopeptide (TPR) repeat protein